METAYEIQKDIKTDTYFLKSKKYIYTFDWETLLQVRKKLSSYPDIEQIDNWYHDLDMFTRKRIKKIEL